MNDATKRMDAVAIDGPAGSGKSSVAKQVARALGFFYVDTGAMYRAIALKAMRLGVDLENPEAMAETAREATVAFDDAGARTYLDGEDVTDAIRSRDVGNNVKCAARVPAIRERMVRLQQRMMEDRPVVMEGRDITTVVLPGARWKFFLTAGPEVRARRRFRETVDRGEAADYDAILDEINRRDAADYQVGPMKEARDRALAGDGIHYVDTSAMSPEEVVAALLERIGTARNDISE